MWEVAIIKLSFIFMGCTEKCSFNVETATALPSTALPPQSLKKICCLMIVKNITNKENHSNDRLK
jgi:hypothetical protein